MGKKRSTTIRQIVVLLWEIFSSKLHEIGRKAITTGIRLSMHPGQYTVLNSPDEAVVERAVEDLRYHARFLDAMGLEKEHKIVLHIGGIYDDKTYALKRFVRHTAWPPTYKLASPVKPITSSNFSSLFSPRAPA